MEKDQFYKTIPSRHEYIGERYFRFNNNSEKVVQVCTFTGDVKKGKSNTFGVYLIHKMTFLCNYLAVGYCEQITEAQYKKQFKKVIKNLE